MVKMHSINSLLLTIWNYNFIYTKFEGHCDLCTKKSTQMVYMDWYNKNAINK